MKTHFMNAESADFMVHSEQGTGFPAHKIVLAARSPFFHHMLTSNMYESSANSSTIYEASDEAIRAFLYYLYTGELSIISDDIVDLLRLSDLYQLIGLKDLIKRELEKLCDKELLKQIYSAANIT